MEAPEELKIENTGKPTVGMALCYKPSISALKAVQSVEYIPLKANHDHP